MLKICLAFWKSEPQYAYKRYAYKKNMYIGYKTLGCYFGKSFITITITYMPEFRQVTDFRDEKVMHYYKMS